MKGYCDISRFPVPTTGIIDGSMWNVAEVELKEVASLMLEYKLPPKESRRYIGRLVSKLLPSIVISPEVP